MRVTKRMNQALINLSLRTLTKSKKSGRTPP